MSHAGSILAHPCALKHVTAGSTPVPLHVRIEVTECCNLQCSFCVWHDRQSHSRIQEVTSYTGSASLPAERLLSLVDELKELGTKAISFTGAGDPLVYPQMERVLQRIEQNKIRFAVTSNFSMPLTDSLLNMLCKASWIRVSMNAAEPETYETIHHPVEHGGERVFGRLQSNIQRLIAARTASASDLQVNASFVVSEQNGDQVFKAANLAKMLGFDRISFRPDDPSIRGIKSLPFSQSVRKQLEAARSMENDTFHISAVDSQLTRTHKKIKGLRCEYAHHTAYIAATGEVYPCCYTRYDTRFRIGTIITTPFRDFWWSRQHQDHLRHLVIENCPECPYDDTNIQLNNFTTEGSHDKQDADDFI